MKNLTLLGAVITAFSLCSCEKYQDEKQVEKTSQIPMVDESMEEAESGYNIRALFSTNHAKSIETAEEEATAFADVLFNGDNNEYHHGKNRIIRDVKIITKDMIRSGQFSEFLPDTLSFVFNFADSTGFAIVSADDRTGYPVLACVEQGSFDKVNDIDNPGMQIFLDNSINYISSEIIKFEKNKAKLKSDVLSLYRDYFNIHKKQNNGLKKLYKGSYYTIEEEQGIPTLMKTRWGQNAPFNKALEICESINHKKTGCWTTAIAQVFAYLKYPQNISGKPFDWNIASEYIGPKYSNGDDRFNETFIHNLSTMFKYIGDGIGVDYGCSSSGASAPDVRYWLNKIGFGMLDGNYSWGKTKLQLDCKRPVLTYGKKDKNTFLGITYSYEGGHAWVTDGYKRTKSIYEKYWVDTDKGESGITSSEIKYINTYLHINWGWNGLNNGYFAEGCFDASKWIELDDKNLYIENTDNYRYEQGIINLFIK